MSSIDTGATGSEAKASIGRAMTPPRRKRLKIDSILGGFLLTGIFLALSAAALPLAAVYSFVWWAQH
jgi:hypothetical protein